MKNYYLPFAAAYVRGHYQQSRDFDLPTFLQGEFDQLSDEDMLRLYTTGREAGLRLHRYKRSRILPRVQKVLGALRGIYPANLLDIGSGRGTFLWPLLDSFPALPVTAIDANPERARQLQAVERGGIERLSAFHMDATALSFEDHSFDVVTALEVLEHIPQVEAALGEIIRVAQRFVIISVPSREDNNPEHIHLLTQARMQHMLAAVGVQRVKFEYVHNHMIVVANVKDG
jgi:ubiquinone/menaquinone biosynthesis C-methylase UbiE